MSDLLPCPFCGGEAEYEHIDYVGDNFVDKWCVICSDHECGTTTDICTDKELAAKWWNTRTPSPAVQQVVEAAKDHCSTHGIDPAFRCDLEPCDLCIALAVLEGDE